MFPTNAPRPKLPAIYEEKYHSEVMKSRIADIGMWDLIPAVSGTMNSRNGEKRLAENDPLFAFIDTYLTDIPYAFEPNMLDGRFVLLPAKVMHQGIGLCASREMPGFLDICIFFYPEEYISNIKHIGGPQVCIPFYSVKPGKELAEMVHNLFSLSEKDEPICTISFDLEHSVTLRGKFLDKPRVAEKQIRDALKDAPEIVQKNGEALIMWLRDWRRQLT